MFKKIASIANIKVWFKQPTWKKSKLFGRACLNYYLNGTGRKMTFVFTNNNKQRIRIDCPLDAINKIITRIKKDGPIRYSEKERRAWKYIEWRKK